MDATRTSHDEQQRVSLYHHYKHNHCIPQRESRTRRMEKMCPNRTVSATCTKNLNQHIFINNFIGLSLHNIHSSFFSGVGCLIIVFFWRNLLNFACCGSFVFCALFECAYPIAIANASPVTIITLSTTCSVSKVVRSHEKKSESKMCIYILRWMPSLLW